MPFDPYYLGLWLGDGTATKLEITTSDVETMLYIRSLVDKYNAKKPKWAKPLKVSVYLTHAKGDWISTLGCFANVDCYKYAIVSTGFGDKDGTRQRWNPLRKHYHKLELFGKLNKHIPAVFFDAHEDVRMAMLAGMIDSDGTYIEKDNAYRITQCQEYHEE